MHWEKRECPMINATAHAMHIFPSFDLAFRSCAASHLMNMLTQFVKHIINVKH